MGHELSLLTPGPFEYKQAEPCHAGSAPESASKFEGSIARTPPEPTNGPTEDGAGPERSLDCAHYDECLNLAAALNWPSFTCAGCCGEVNDALVWRAHQSARKDSVARRLCGLRPLVIVKGQRTDEV